MTEVLTPEDTWGEVVGAIDAGDRLIGLFGTAPDSAADGEGVRLTAVLARGGVVELHDREVGDRFASLTPVAPAAFAYERIVHDLFGIHPIGHPRLDPLVLAGLHAAGDGPATPPRPGAGERPATRLVPQGHALPRYLQGAGLFTIPHGPVRSGVTESLEFLVETPGEDILRLQIRVYHKHRGVEIAFESRDPADGVLLAERVEGVASVAHATAYCQALERLGAVTVPRPAGLLRLVHAELERIVGHLEVVARLCESAALAVGIARFTAHKEEVQRIRHVLSGSRFGRGVVVPGGVVAPERLAPSETGRRVRALAGRVRRDRDLLMVTSSFLDRLRGTGLLDPDLARDWGAVGPVGRASGVAGDVRRDAPYDAYAELVPAPVPETSTLGDVQARLEVRWAEIDASFELIDTALVALHESGAGPWQAPVPSVDGRAVGAVEGPQGETVYVVEVAGGRLRRVWPRTASLHNIMLLHDVFHTDVLTDFPFIEASFAVSNAGVVL